MLLSHKFWSYYDGKGIYEYIVPNELTLSVWNVYLPPPPPLWFLPDDLNFDVVSFPHNLETSH